MRLLHRHRAVLYRRAEGDYNDVGDWVAGELTDGRTFPCCVQPYEKGSKASKVKALPEGFRERDVRTIYTREELKMESEEDSIDSDIIEYQGSLFVVWEVYPWTTAANSLHHYEATLIRKDIYERNNQTP